ncbi:unnamed protein product [Bathycoccus prasinos]
MRTKRALLAALANRRISHNLATVEKKYIHEQDLTSIGGIKVVANVPRKRSIKEDSENGNDKDAGENMFDDSKWHDDANRRRACAALA